MVSKRSKRKVNLVDKARTLAAEYLALMRMNVPAVPRNFSGIAPIKFDNQIIVMQYHQNGLAGVIFFNADEVEEMIAKLINASNAIDLKEVFVESGDDEPTDELGSGEEGTGEPVASTGGDSGSDADTGT